MQKCFPLAFAVLVSLPISAESIKVANWSFEDITGTEAAHFDSAGKLRPGHYVTFSPPFDANGTARSAAVPGWSGFGLTGSMAALVGDVPGRRFDAIPEGRNTAFFMEDDLMEQALTNRIRADTRYVLQVDVGRPYTTASQPNWLGAGLILRGDGQRFIEISSPPDLLPGQFRTLEASYSVTAADPFVGKVMGLLLFGGIGEVHFDNVRLSEISLAAPPAVISPAVEVSWISKLGEWYRVERSASITSPQWAPISAPLQGTGGRLAVFEVAGSDVAYYRLIPVPPP